MLKKVSDYKDLVKVNILRLCNNARMTAPPMGLRERKKLATRQLIAETARRLFAERGFDGVTVAEVARAAEVSEKTVFNYFATKEDLVYWRLEAFEAQILEAVSMRAPGESALDAFRRFVLAQRGLMVEHDPERREQLLSLSRVIAQSPALVEREQQIFGRFTASLAALLAEETSAAPDDVEPRVAANAMMGVHRALVRLSRERVLAGATTNELQAELTASGERALKALEAGLGAYAVR
jgi:AcrR family transcriptional regulator